MRLGLDERKSEKGFSLIELIVVLVILGLLAGIVVYNLQGVGDRARIQATQAQIASVEGALKLYQTAVGTYPESLELLITKPSDENDAAKWTGPYIEEKDRGKLKDAWGNELIYKAPGDVNVTSYDLSSPGPDKQPGNDDDVTNWTKT